ncbi:HEAT repeat domain-containing protein [Luteibacter aegosomaticola]|uniref:HEAT repeat domain-containing protein n=1 Tax=Luteibacter aegosomaticola TaxID=2911538 RepID=UPI001FF8AD9C|nr:HEAT repeat domain-containing protein [Luteibacter aegosomaticola]UPG90310.1 HEAT repeat domain-containing protein [Luteibacter aegosomaticola]
MDDLSAWRRQLTQPLILAACLVSLTASAQTLPPIDIGGAPEPPVDIASLVAHLRSPSTDPIDDYPSELFELAALGPAAGPEAGETVTALLASPRPYLRAMAAAALGFMQYAPARKRLQEALSDETDAATSAYAAMSLGRLGDRAALPALREAARSYWYPPVRKVASKAIDQIETHAPLAPFVRTDWIFPGSLYYATGCPTTERPMVPTTLTVEGGRLYGIDNGEFGGGLFFDDGHGGVQKIGEMNVQGIATLGSHIVAVTGLAHMGWVRGDVYRVERNASGRWQAIQWRHLPYAPYGAVAEPGRLRIVLPRADILLSGDGKFSMATCPDTHHGEWRQRVG